MTYSVTHYGIYTIKNNGHLWAVTNCTSIIGLCETFLMIKQYKPPVSIHKLIHCCWMDFNNLSFSVAHFD